MTDPHQILTQYRDQLHAMSTQLLSGIPTTGAAVVRGDETTPCGDGTEEWPSRWEYTVEVVVAGTQDARPQAQHLFDQLRADGWRLRDDPSGGDGQLGVIAQRDGFGLIVGGTSTQGFLQIDAYSPCVSRNGHIDRGYAS